MIFLFSDAETHSSDEHEPRDNVNVGRELKNNAFEIGRVGDNLARVKDELHRISKYASMVATQAEQVLKAQNDLLMN